MRVVGKPKKNMNLNRNHGLFVVAVLSSFALGRLIPPSLFTTRPPITRTNQAQKEEEGALHKTTTTTTTHQILSEKDHDLLPVVLLDLPSSVKEIIINVGSNLDPIMPAYSMGPCAHSIAIEPIVGCNIAEHRQLSIIHAAVSDRPGVATMIQNNNNGLSSSLSKPAKDDFWNTNNERGDGKRVIVPVITLSSVLNAIPSTVKIPFIKTDMQGFDFAAVKATGSILKERVVHIMNEVWFDDVYSYDAENDFCRDWLPFMTDLGYVLIKVEGWGGSAGEPPNPNVIAALCQQQLDQFPERPTVQERPGLVEGNVYWVRHDAIDVQLPHFDTVLEFDQSHFLEEDYATCDSA
jgi:FkbM family methyltransferase